ncbi:hypothetical protein C483_02121 [Natrialba hulunbeirensis JCM 10989]|uniref:DUF262 domain-containing protein n=1 Tax=Natrialba hulunbeirensis JCM 10989 TaxID=1227493 RepID=M0AB78_9EURY|nr:DUF262 domain-containing protein [Natrialba hulunbeirensis]ELY95122.1 hypothetical protein C483_02121 [Natrialba hulunbeirensis JCM 10989]
METRTVDVDALLKDGLFDIPSYQRSYSWKQSQLKELFEDLLYLPDESTHFFGNIILDEQQKRFRTDRGRRFTVFDVVDGQQRLTSALIFLHAAAEYDEFVAETLEEDNLITPVKERPRLLPQDQDEEYFRDCLFGVSEIDPQTPSQTRLNNAYDYFKRRFEKLDDESVVRDLAERLRYDLRINVVEIDNESEAASIFESLNDRGKPLSTLDKTKSFLMYMDERSSETGALEGIIKQRFGSIYRELFVLTTGHERVTDFDEDSIQRFHWGMYNGYNSDEYFQSFETLKSRLRNSYRSGEYDEIQTEIDSYVRDLREAAAAFAAIFSPSDRPESIETSLRRLLELGRLANVLPVLMAAYLRYGDDEAEKFAKIVEACETLVFRMYAIDSRRSNTGRGKIVRLAHDIHTDASIDHEGICAELDRITAYYTSDERFARNLHDPEFYQSHSSRDIKFLLYHYNRQLEADVDEELAENLSQILSTDFQVEHILARKVDPEHIPEDLSDEFPEYVHRLGNLTIASRYWNSSYGNLPFKKKQHAEGDREKDYASSALRVQRELVDYDQFGKTEIETRQEQLIDFALHEWAIEPTEPEDPEPNGSEEFGGYVPSNFFDRLTTKQETLLRILWEENDWVETTGLLQIMEQEYDIETHGSSTISGLLAGMTRKYPSGYRRSIMSATWTGDQYQFKLDLDSEQKERFAESFGEPHATV